MKAALRKIYKEKRNTLSITERNKLEDLILIQFQKLNIEIPEQIMTYAPIEKFNEFNPQLITDYCFFKNPQQILLYPMVDIAEGLMVAVAVTDDTNFAQNKMGIDEPIDGLYTAEEEIDLIIIPLLAFDEKGNRVGYGKGHYDKFLKACKPDTIKIGFSFFEAEKQIEDVNEFDIKLDYCITPQKIYHF
jgi:5-formyltetrahydrofolate cyclo-ligase